jgi:hypothetical protein
MPDCHEHPFDVTECVHGQHDWCYHCADELTKATEAERDRYKAALLEIRRMWFEEVKFTVMNMAHVAIEALDLEGQPKKKTS